MSDFSYSKDEHNIISILWDVKNKSMNTLTFDGIEHFNECINKALADKDARGIIIGSCKKDFSGGMDLNILQSIMSDQPVDFSKQAFSTIMKIHQMLRKLELAGRNKTEKRTSLPVVWAGSGISAGIGTEIALACHYRIAAEIPETKIGLPEVLIGLFPFGGGTTRIMRMLGAMASSSILLEGKMLSASVAKSLGLINETCDSADLIEKAKNWIISATVADTIKPWDTKGFKVPGGGPYHPSGFLTFVGASAMINSKTQGVYPAHKALMSAAYEGLLVPFETALKIETRWAVKLLNTPSTFNMIRSLFINKTALDKGAVRPKNIEPQQVKKVGILGAGMMGSGIAYVSAIAGIEVVLIDATQENADKGKSKVKGILQEGVKRRKTSLEQLDRAINLIEATDSYEKLKGVDLVVEAVFEDPKVKGDVTASAEKYTSDNTIFASNTSTLPISELAKASKNSKNFIGIHFFSPVNKMNLVEIIKGKETNERAICKALDFVKQIRKTPIVVNDARFFYANRCIIPYLNEGVKMVGEGINPSLIDNAARQLGMPVGPLQLIDETSIDLANQIAVATKNALGDKYIASESDKVLDLMVSKGRLGRKSNAGFYEYDEKGKRQNFWKNLSLEWPALDPQPTIAQVKTRLGLIQALEAVRAFEEGVLTDIREGDVGAILGWGCIPWAGGPFGWLDLLGAKKILNVCNEFSNTFGPRFNAPQIIEDMAKTNSKFYDQVKS